MPDRLQNRCLTPGWRNRLYLSYHICMVRLGHSISVRLGYLCQHWECVCWGFMSGASRLVCCCGIARTTLPGKRYTVVHSLGGKGRWCPACCGWGKVCFIAFSLVNVPVICACAVALIGVHKWMGRLWDGGLQPWRYTARSPCEHFWVSISCRQVQRLLICRKHCFVAACVVTWLAFGLCWWIYDGAPCAVKDHFRTSFWQGTGRKARHLPVPCLFCQFPAELVFWWLDQFCRVVSCLLLKCVLHLTDIEHNDLVKECWMWAYWPSLVLTRAAAAPVLFVSLCFLWHSKSPTASAIYSCAILMFIMISANCGLLGWMLYLWVYTILLSS